MKPYYEHAGITIYNADCRLILPTLPKCDLLLTDPPYPSLQGGIEHFNGGGVSRRVIHGSKTIGEPWNISPEEWIPVAIERSIRGAFVFCSYHSIAQFRTSVPCEVAYLLTWYKRNSPVAVCNVPRFTTEFIWAFKLSPGLIWRKIENTLFDIPAVQGGCMAVERFVDATGKSEHPSQKPIELIGKLLVVEPSSVIDCFSGTGTTLEACKARGIPAIGIEIEERYCEIAAKRLQQEVFDFGGTE
jgi:DNA modification methylase